jgi:hypothetical protein
MVTRLNTTEKDEEGWEVVGKIKQPTQQPQQRVQAAPQQATEDGWEIVGKAPSLATQPAVDEEGWEVVGKTKENATNQTKRMMQQMQENTERLSISDAEFGGFAPALGGEAPTPPLKPKEIPKTKFDDLTKPENFNLIKDYAVARFGESGKQRKDESNTDYVKRWMRAMRFTTLNTANNAVPELIWLNNAKKEEVAKAAKAWELYDSVPDFYEEGGQGGVMPFLEGAAAVVSDVTNLASAGLGSFAKYQIARGLIQNTIKQKAKSAIVSGSVGATIGAAAETVQQQIKVDTGRQTEIKAGEVAFAAGLEALFSAGETAGAIAAGRKIKSTKEDLEDVLKGKMPAKTDAQKEKFLQVWDKELESTLTEFDKFEGRQVLDKLSPPTELVEGQVKKGISRRAVEVAQYILLNDPNFKDAKERVANKEQMVSDAIRDVFMSLDKKRIVEGVETSVLDDVVFEAALNRAGITFKEFAQAGRTSVGDGASVMAAYSTAAKKLRQAMSIDEESLKVLEKMYGRNQEIPDSYGWFGNGVRRIEREGKALVVSSIGTTIRNVMGTGIGLTYESATRLVESSIYAAGKTIKAGWDITVNKKPYEKGALTKGINDIVKDSFNNLVYLTNAGISAEVADKILKNNPRIQNQIFSALQETGNQELSKVAKFANTFNVAQDALFRRAIFNASVERQLRRAGMDMYQILADDKLIPSDIIKNAADEALMGTFSFMPKKGLGHYFVKTFEAPFMSLINPFPRFMVNAISFQMKYNPIIAGARAASDASQALLKKGTDPVVAERLGRRAVERLSQGIIGGAALTAAYQYRTENPDIPAYELQNADGTTTDTRAIFPIGPILVTAELARLLGQGKWSDIKVKETLETLAGMKIPSGTQMTFLESLPELAQAALETVETKELNRAKETVGRFVGDFASRFIQPLQPITQYLETFVKEAQIARDPNVIESEAIVSETVLNRIKNKLPLEAIPEGAVEALPEGAQPLVEPLPEAVQFFREGPPVRPGEFFNTLMGSRPTPVRNKFEKAAREAGVEPYTFYTPSGIRAYDRAVITAALPYIEELVGERIDREDYKDLSKDQKNLAFSAAMREAVANGRDEALANFSEENQQALHKLTYYKLPARQRRIINAAYARENDGRTIDEDNAFDRYYEYLGELAVR